MRLCAIKAAFVEFIPEQLDEGTLYISPRFKTAVHLCACGCGGEVVTPLSPAEWRLSKAGGTVSLWPSIGNWGFPCQSHYWIKANRVIWDQAMTPAQIERVRARDHADKQQYIAAANAAKGERDLPASVATAASARTSVPVSESLFGKARRVLWQLMGWTQ